jgi:cell fate regulator YaaT (PSP1 superfamily)
LGAISEAGEIIEVSFKGGRKGFYKNSGNLDIETGDYVIVEADRGTDFGMVHLQGELVRLRLKSTEKNEPEALPQVVRKARLKDVDRWEVNKERETETFLLGRQMADRMNLPM